jgi:hypothetical protein
MNIFIDPKDVASVRYKDNFLWDTMEVIFKNGTKKTYREFADMNWNLYNYYKHLLSEIKK